jgi:hypothetical protein
MLIGTFVSIVGLQTLFREEYPADPSIRLPSPLVSLPASLLSCTRRQLLFLRSPMRNSVLEMH